MVNPDIEYDFRMPDSSLGGVNGVRAVQAVTRAKLNQWSISEFMSPVDVTVTRSGHWPELIPTAFDSSCAAGCPAVARYRLPAVCRQRVKPESAPHHTVFVKL